MLETSTSPRRTGILDPVERFAGAVSVEIRPLGPQTRFVLRLGAEDAVMLGHLAGLQLAVADQPHQPCRGAYCCTAGA